MIQSSAFTRRQFLGAVGVGSLGASLSGCGGPSPWVEDPPIPPPDISNDLGLRLLNRTTFGPSPKEINEINAIGYEAYLEQQLDPDGIDDGQLDARLASLTTLTAPITKIIDREENDVRVELIKARVLRAALSRRQLYERMVEFWTDHFTIYQNQEAVIFLKTVDDREVVRAHALGNFRDMLRASSKSPAMLVYLNNNVNVAGSPNENYARELLELHTVGVDGGYTQGDVEEMARALTGWSVFDKKPDIGKFAYRQELHDDGPKQIMGLTLPAGGGITDGEKAIDYLAGHEQTARFIAGKLVRHFVAESAPASLVDRVAGAFQSSQGDIKATLRELFSQSAMALAEPKFKRPLHSMVDVIRRSGSTITDEIDLGEWLSLLGHMPFNWPSPDGYPDAPEYWAPGLLNRWNLAAALAFGEIKTVALDAESLAKSLDASTPQEVIDLWDGMFHSGNLPDAEREAMLEYVSRDASDPARLYYESLAMAISTPAFQWC